MSKISIITVNYNNAVGLEKTIASVLAQTLSGFEFIIIDGNSSDGGKEIIQRNADKITYWVSEPDSGIYNAMNKGIKNATGEYLLFLNSGDILHQTNTLSTVDPYVDGTSDIYYGDIIYDEKSIKTRRSFPEKLSFSYFLEHSISHQASFIKRSLFDQFFYYNETYSIISDWEFFIYAICKRNVPTKKIDQIITDYDATGLSSNLANHGKMHQERAEVINKYFPAFADDYKETSFFKSKRGQQIIRIKNHRLHWKVLKGVLNIILLFLPKKQ